MQQATPEPPAPGGENGSDQPKQPKIDVRGSRGVVIGDFARVVINGIDEKVFRRLGLNVNVGFALLAVLIIAAAGVILYMLLPRQGNMKSDLGCELCIAVAGFSEIAGPDYEGIGEVFGATLSRRLQDNLADLKAQSELTIEVWGPSQVGKVQGKSITDLDRSAHELAQKAGADILVYGLIDTSGNAWQVSPRFYISPDYTFQDSLEVIGQDQLGAPFSVLSNQKDAVRDKLMNDRASSRGRLLAALAVGMTHYLTYDYENALRIFESAVGDAQNWEDPTALSLLYLMMGNALLPQYEKDPGNQELLQKAEGYYGLALDSNRRYARSYLGIGSVAYLRALSPAVASSNPADTDMDLLSESIEFYQAAAGLAPEPDLAHVKEKAHAYLGRALVAGAYAQLYTQGQLPNLQPAVDEFQQVIQAYEQAPDEILRDLVVDSHATLALIARLEGRVQDSIREYQTALELTDDPTQIDLYKKALATMQAPDP